MRDNGGVAYTATDATASGLYFNHYEVTALDQIGTTKMKITNVENGIRITLDKAAPVSVYNLAGMTVKNCNVNSEAFISLARGAYIVKSGTAIQKVIVK